MGLELTWRAALLKELGHTVQLAPAVGRHGHGGQKEANWNVPAVGRVQATVAAPFAPEIGDGINVGFIVDDHHRFVVLNVCAFLFVFRFRFVFVFVLVQVLARARALSWF